MRRLHRSSGPTGPVAPLLVPLLCSLLVLPLITAPEVFAHETDQYTLPAGRQFADLGPYFNKFFYGCIERGVNKTNARIRKAIEEHRSQSELDALESGETIAHAVDNEFPYAIFYIQTLDDLTTSPPMMSRYPGYVTGYKPAPTFEKVAMFPLNPIRAWGCATMNVYGSYIGTDKIGHFTDMGMHYYQTYVGYRKKGMSEEQAVRQAIYVGTDEPLTGESKLLGYWTAGDYSNADLVANYTGMLFYRNLSEPQNIKGQLRPPMLVRDGPYWRIAPHVRADNDFFAIFISDHLDEALNPGHFLENMRPGLRDEIVNNAESILDHRTDSHGQRRSPAWFAAKSRELRTYWGFDYGHRGDDSDLLLIDQICFAPPKNDADRDARGRDALERAVDAGDAQAVSRLIDAGAKVNDVLQTHDPFSSQIGNTPLHLAARDGNDQIVKLLIAKGADVNAQNERGVTPLHLAIGHETAAQILLDAGARTDLADGRGRTALHWAASDADATTVALLLAHGASPLARDDDGRTPLHLAAAVPGRVTVINELLSHGADVNAPDDFHQTPLHLAAALKSPDVAQLLIRNGATVAVRDDFGRTPLHDASRVGSEQVAAVLLRSGAGPAIADAYGRTPLHLAARDGHEQIARLLIQYGADALAGGGNGSTNRTPIDEARQAGHKQLAINMRQAMHEHATLAAHSDGSSGGSERDNDSPRGNGASH